MRFKEYQSLKAVNWSTLKHMAMSPLHYLHATNNPQEETDVMRFGRLVHCMVLEPEQVSSNFAVWEGGRRYGKEWDAFNDACAADTIVTREQLERAAESAQAIRSHPLVAPLLNGALFEVTNQWTDALTGIACKSRCDVVTGAIVDLKLTADIREFRVAAQTARMGYHAQLAFYADGWATKTGENRPAIIIAAEPKPPYDVAVYELDEDTLATGQAHYQRLLDRLKQCRESGQYPGMYTDRQALRLPRYALEDDEDATGLDLDLE